MVGIFPKMEFLQKRSSLFTRGFLMQRSLEASLGAPLNRH